MRRAEIISLKTTIQTDTIKHLRIRNNIWQKVQKYDINKQNQKNSIVSDPHFLLRIEIKKNIYYF